MYGRGVILMALLVFCTTANGSQISSKGCVVLVRCTVSIVKYTSNGNAQPQINLDNFVHRKPVSDDAFDGIAFAGLESLGGIYDIATKQEEAKRAPRRAQLPEGSIIGESVWIGGIY